MKGDSNLIVLVIAGYVFALMWFSSSYLGHHVVGNLFMVSAITCFLSSTLLAVNKWRDIPLKAKKIVVFSTLGFFLVIIIVLSVLQWNE